MRYPPAFDTTSYSQPPMQLFLIIATLLHTLLALWIAGMLARVVRANVAVGNIRRFVVVYFVLRILGG